MRLKILGSSSRGNSYILQASNGEILCIEAGVRFSDVKRAVDYKIKNIVGCLLTHCHKDHSLAIHDFEKAYIPLLMTPGTAKALSIDNYVYPSQSHPVRIGGFRVLSFPVEHDAVQPCGFLIQHEECGVVLFATDTAYLKPTFPGLNNIIIEANYSQEILDRNREKGYITQSQRDRVVLSHMSLSTCCRTLQANDLSSVANIVLIHLSNGNSNARQFHRDVADLTQCNVFVAEAGLEIPFNKTPY